MALVGCNNAVTIVAEQHIFAGTPLRADNLSHELSQGRECKMGFFESCHCQTVSIR